MKTIQEMVQEATGATGTLLTLSLVGIKEIEAFAALVREDAQRKPLTDKEIGVLWFEANDQDNSMVKHFARAIEAAHNITAATQLKE